MQISAAAASAEIASEELAFVPPSAAADPPQHATPRIPGTDVTVRAGSDSTGTTAGGGYPSSVAPATDSFDNKSPVEIVRATATLTAVEISASGVVTPTPVVIVATAAPASTVTAHRAPIGDK
jgi:hypothetical protein